MPTCENCGKPVIEQAVFCSSCGARVASPPTPSHQNVHAASSSESTTRRKRPAWVWVITAYYGLWLAVSFWAFYMALKSSALQKTPFGIRDWVFYGSILLELTLALAAIITLFMLRKQALLFFAALLAMYVIPLAYLAATEGLDAALRIGGNREVFHYGTMAVVCLYVWKLKNAGTLR
jgi:hypothetical protein